MRRLGTITSSAGVGVLLVGLILNLTTSVEQRISDPFIAGGLVLIFIGLIMTIRPRLQHTVPAALAATGSILFLLIIVAANIIADRFSLRSDFTRTGRFTLSEQTTTILSTLARDIHAVGFFPEGEGMDARDLLTEYDKASDRFSFRFVDPDRNPDMAERYNIREYGTVVFESGDRQERVTEHTENIYTSALARLVRDEPSLVSFVTGHGERGIDDTGREGITTIAHRLTDEGFQVNETMIVRDGLPPRESVLVIAGPRTPLLPSEADSLRTFVAGGGRVICCVEPGGSSLIGFLKPMGITPREDTIIDISGLGSLFGMSEVVPLVATYNETHAITARFNAATFFPLCRSLAIADTVPDGSSVTCLAFTSEASWGEIGGEVLDEVQFDDGIDVPGPLCVFALIESDSSAMEDSGVGREEWSVAVFGDVDFASNGYCDVSANGDLFLNTVSWMSRREGLMGIRAKEGDGGPIMLSSQAARSIFILVVVLMPGIPLVAGISLWLRRR